VTTPSHYKGTITRALGALTKAFGKSPPDVAVVLGSGLGSFADHLESSKTLSYQRIPGFQRTSVPGHAGECAIGKIGGKRVLIFRGRFHYYEGHSLTITTLPIRTAGAWKIPNLIVTNAAGGLRPEFKPGSLMLIRDHLNLVGANPLRGPNLEQFGPRFSDMSSAYDAEFRELAKKVAADLKIQLHEGVYAGLAGPSYETPAEIRMLRTLGADAVGMSTVPEVIVAKHQGMRVLGISCVTNHAAGVSDQTVNHEEVIENSKKAERDFCELLARFIERVQG
jgi:purine-nucleoside phosphorylase